MSFIVYFLNYVLLSRECFFVMAAVLIVLGVLFFAKRKVLPSWAKTVLIVLLAVCVVYFLFIAVFVRAIPLPV